MNPLTPHAEFVPSTKGRILISFHRAAGPPRGCVLFVPPFAEEMNKSRRMFALLGQSLAQRGFASLLPDLFGTGDSEGEFAEADWTVWREDIATAVRWASQHLASVDGLVALRLGAELAADATETGGLPPVQRAVLWQPVFDRARHLTQFLRLRTAAALTKYQEGTADDTKRQLQQGLNVEVAGYELPASLGQQMLESTPRNTLPFHWGRVLWIETQRDSQAPLAAPSRRLVESSRANGIEVDSWTTTGEPFWASTEITTNPGIVARTIESLAS